MLWPTTNPSRTTWLQQVHGALSFVQRINTAAFPTPTKAFSVFWAIDEAA
jgi:hypothetical protein